MRIDFPEHPVGPCLRTPWWLFWRSPMRRKHWRWIVDHTGCHVVFYWQYIELR